MINLPRNMCVALLKARVGLESILDHDMASRLTKLLQEGACDLSPPPLSDLPDANDLPDLEHCQCMLPDLADMFLCGAHIDTEDVDVTLHRCGRAPLFMMQEGPAIPGQTRSGCMTLCQTCRDFWSGSSMKHAEAQIMSIELTALGSLGIVCPHCGGCAGLSVIEKLSHSVNSMGVEDVNGVQGAHMLDDPSRVARCGCGWVGTVEQMFDAGRECGWKPAPAFSKAEFAFAGGVVSP